MGLPILVGNSINPKIMKTVNLLNSEWDMKCYIKKNKI